MNEIFIVWDLDDDQIIEDGGIHFDFGLAEDFMTKWTGVNGGNCEVRRYVQKEYSKK